MKMRKLLLYCFFIFSIALQSQPFESLIDSVDFYKNSDPDKAIQFGLEAINIGYTSVPNVNLLKVNTLVGQILGEQNLDGQAIRFYNESLKLFSAIPVADRIEKKIQLPPWVLVNIGNIYFKNNDLLLAEKKYHEAKNNFLLYQNTSGKNFGLCTVYDNLALIELKRKDFESATKYYSMSSSIRNASGKAEDILYSKLGMLTLHIRQDNPDNVDRLFREIKSFFNHEVQKQSSTQETNYLKRNYGYSYVAYADYMSKKNDYTTALELFEEAEILLIDFPVESPNIQSDISAIHFALGNMKQAEELSLKTIDQLPQGKYIGVKRRNLALLEKIYTEKGDMNSLLKIKDAKLNLLLDQEAFHLDRNMGELESYLLLSEKQDEIVQNKLRYRNYIYALILLCIVLLFLFFTLQLNYRYQEIKSKEALAEKRMIQMELDNKNLALINKSNFIAQHNKNLNYILSSSKKEKEDSTTLKAKIESLLTSFKVNERFEKQFEEVYPNFFKKLMNTSGVLTQNDLRLCACLRLNQSTKEIAFMLGVSIRTIESQKYRLKKKLSLSKSDNLITFLHKI